MPARAARLGLAVALALGVAGRASAGEDLPRRLVGHGGPVMAIAVSPGQGRALTASFDYSVILWALDAPQGRVLHRLIGHEAAVNDVAFLPGGRAVSVSDDGSAAFWRLADGALLRRLAGDPVKTLDLAVSGDGRFVAVARWDGTARILDAEAMTERARLAGHRGPVNAVAFSADAATVFTGAQDGTIRAWDRAAGAETRILHEHGWGVNVLARAGGALVFGGVDGTLARLDPATGAVAELARADRPILALDVSADGGRLAAGDGAGRIRVFRTGDWTLEEEFEDGLGPVWEVAFADAVGTRLFHGGLDDTASLWQVAPRQPFEPLAGTYPRRFQETAAASLGERQFRRKCSVCHTLGPDDGNRAGPSLFGLFGRQAGTLPGYPFSEGLKRSGIVWDEASIARLFDHGPDVVTPGSKMPLQRLTDAAERNALVAFLKVATDPVGAAVEQGGRGR